MSLLTRLCVLLALLPFGVASTASAEEVLYCADNEITGFAPEAQYSLRRYEPQRFTIKADFETNEIYAKQLYLSAIHGRRCTQSVAQNDVFYCYNDLGTVIALHKKTLKYHLSVVYLDDADSKDDIYVSHGQCEKF